MHRPRLIPRAALVAALLLVPSALAGPAVAADAAVTIRIGSTLDPAEVTVAPGTRITWVNADDDRHRVRSRSGLVEFDSGNLEPGERFSISLAAAGTYAYLDDRDREDTAYHGRILVSTGPTATPAPPSGGGGGGGGGGGTPTAPSSASFGMAGRQFSPASVTIATGGSVTWRNDDDDDHTVTGRSGAFDSGGLAPGATYRRTFSTAGTFAFLCAFHPDMTGTVRVVAPGAATAPPAPPATPAPTPRPTSSPAAPGAGGPAARSASIVDLAFEPASLEVAAGTTVTWRNDGAAPHSVTATDGAFDSGFLSSGESWSNTFATPGTFAFFCAIHPEMRGSITINAAAGVGGAAVSASASGSAVPSASASVSATATPSSAASTTVAPADATASPASVDGQAASQPGGTNLGGAALSLAGIGLAVGAFAKLLRGTIRP